MANGRKSVGRLYDIAFSWSECSEGFSAEGRENCVRAMIPKTVLYRTRSARQMPDAELQLATPKNLHIAYE